MTYFLKNKNTENYKIMPLLMVSLIIKDLIKLKINDQGGKFLKNFQGSIIKIEVILSLYLAAWKIVYFIIFDLIEDTLNCEKEELKISDRLFLDLNLDSVDLAKIALQMEKNVGIPIYEDIDFERIIDLIDYIFYILIRQFKLINFVCESYK